MYRAMQQELGDTLTIEIRRTTKSTSASES